jgi:transcription elongation GreA/GreB family factor
MTDYTKIKQQLYQNCLEFVDERLKTVTNIMDSNKKALFSETKSSAGDKHETGRAMLQLEMEKTSQQYNSINQMKQIIQKINLEKNSEVISLGSLIITDKANYFLAISYGKISIDSVDYYAVSTNSPIGKQLLGKHIGDVILFNNAEILEIY